MKTGIATGDYEPDRNDQARQDIVRVLEARFGTLPAAIIERIRAVNEAERLTMLLVQAVTTLTVDEFAQALSARWDPL